MKSQNIWQFEYEILKLNLSNSIFIIQLSLNLDRSLAHYSWSTLQYIIVTQKETLAKLSTKLSLSNTLASHGSSFDMLRLSEVLLRRRILANFTASLIITQDPYKGVQSTSQKGHTRTQSGNLLQIHSSAQIRRSKEMSSECSTKSQQIKTQQTILWFLEWW